MKIIVGLGNPGKEYEKTRHNVGFMVLDEVSKQWNTEKKFLAEICQLNKDTILVKPQTFMNDSGKAVRKICDFYKVNLAKDLWVVHDDLDLELGRIKIHAGGPSGHHGIESIIKETGSSEFIKFRLGVGRPTQKEGEFCSYQENKNYVLAPFTKEELSVIKASITKMAQAVITGLEQGIEKAMNEFNK